jgi:predicted nucleic acid-binding protein
MSQSITQFSDNAIYLDTMAFYAFLRIAEPTAQQLFQRIETGQLQAYTSVLTFDELAYRLLLALIRDHHSGSPLDNLRQNETDLIAAYYPHVAPKLQRLQTLTNLTLINITGDDLISMHHLILKYHLRPRDALHLAAMHYCDCFSLISNDRDFDRVPGILRYTIP